MGIFQFFNILGGRQMEATYKNKNVEGIFREVDINKIPIDKILSHIPQNSLEEAVMAKIKEAVFLGNVKKFWAPKYNPGLDSKTKQIIFEEGIEPCSMLTPLWEAQAKIFNPKRGSRLGNKYERAIYLAYLINELILEGKNEEEAWEIVSSGNGEKLKEYEDISMAKITLTEGQYNLWDARNISKLYDVGYNFSYCENAVGWVILTKPE